MSTQEQYIQTMILGIRGQLNQIERALKFLPSADLPCRSGYPTMVTIIQVVAEYFGLNPSDLTGHCNEAHLVTPRYIAIYLCRDLTGSSKCLIARTFKRHHTSVYYALQQQELRGDRQVVADVRRLLVGDRA